MTKQNKGRKLFAVSASAALVASAIVPVAASASYNDESSIASWATESVNYVTEKGFMQGNNGNFDPQGTFTRAQAAVVAVKVLGLDTTKEFEPTFGDVKEGQWFFEEVSAAAEAEIIKGSNGNFRPNDKLTRQEAAVILTKIYGLDVEAADVTVLDQFSDKGSIAPYATKYLAALVEADVMKGSNGKLNPTGNIARQELAVMLAKSDQTLVDPLVKALEELGEAVEAVEAIGKVTVENKAKAQAAVDALNEAIAAVEAFELAPEDEDILGLIKEVKEIATKVQAEIDAVKEPAKELAVESVSAINAKTIEVKFSQEVVKGEAETAGNYVIGGLQSSTTVTPVLGTDDKTVTLTLDKAILNDTTVAVTVEPVTAKADASKKTERYTTSFKFADVEGPKFVNFTNPSAGKVVLNFNEAIDSTLTNVKVFDKDGADVTSKVSLTVGTTDNKTIELTRLTNNEDYKVALVGVKDLAGNLISPNPTEVTVKSVFNDTVKPVAESITASSLTEVKIKFSEPLQVLSGAVEDNDVVYANLTGVTAASGANQTFDTKTNTLTVKIDAVTEGDIKSVKVAGYKDVAGNTGEDFTTNVPFTAKTKVTGTELVTIGTDKYAKVTFDKAVTAAAQSGTNRDLSADLLTADNVASTHTIAGADVIVGTEAPISKATETNVVYIKATELSAGKYTVTIPASVVTNLSTASTKVEFTITAANTNAPAVTAPDSDVVVSGEYVTVHFDASKGDLGQSALDVNNYTVAGQKVFESAVFDGNKTKVKLKLKPAAIKYNGDYDFAIGTGVKGENGVALAKEVKVTKTFTELVAPTIKTAKLVGDNSIVLTFDESIQTAAALAGIEVYVDGTKATLKAVSQITDTTTSTITLEPSTGKFVDAEKVATSTITVKVTSTNNVTDVNGNKLGAVESITVEK